MSKGHPILSLFYTTSDRLPERFLYYLKSPSGEGFILPQIAFRGRLALFKYGPILNMSRKKAEKQQKNSRKKAEMQAAGQHGRNSNRNADTCAVFSVFFLLFFCFFSAVFLFFSVFFMLFQFLYYLKSPSGKSWAYSNLYGPLLKMKRNKAEKKQKNSRKKAEKKQKNSRKNNTSLSRPPASQLPAGPAGQPASCQPASRPASQPPAGQAASQPASQAASMPARQASQPASQPAGLRMPSKSQDPSESGAFLIKSNRPWVSQRVFSGTEYSI